MAMQEVVSKSTDEKTFYTFCIYSFDCAT